MHHGETTQAVDTKPRVPAGSGLEELIKRFEGIDRYPEAARALTNLYGSYNKLIQGDPALAPEMKKRVAELMNNGDPNILYRLTYEYQKRAKIGRKPAISTVEKKKVADEDAQNSTVRGAAQGLIMDQKREEGQKGIQEALIRSRTGRWYKLVDSGVNSRDNEPKSDVRIGPTLAEFGKELKVNLPVTQVGSQSPQK